MSYEPAHGWPIAPWHRWFAWRPVDTLDRGWVWLRVINRRRCQTHDYLGPVSMFFQHAIRV